MKTKPKLSVGAHIARLYRQGQTLLIKEYKALGIGAGQYQFLIQLYLEDGLSHEELTERVSVDKAMTTRAVTKLEEEGYVVREVNANDKRKYHIHLTPKALQKKDEVFRISTIWENKLTVNITDEELQQLHKILNKITHQYNPE